MIKFCCFCSAKIEKTSKPHHNTKFPNAHKSSLFSFYYYFEFILLSYNISQSHLMNISQGEPNMSSLFFIFLFNSPLQDSNALMVKYPLKVHVFDTWFQLVLSLGEVGELWGHAVQLRKVGCQTQELRVIFLPGFCPSFLPPESSKDEQIALQVPTARLVHSSQHLSASWWTTTSN